MPNVLSARDEVILGAIALNGIASIAEIAKETALAAHTIRHCVQRLGNQGLIKPRLYLNLSNLGYQEYSVFFSLNPSSKCRSLVINFLLNCENVNWCVELVGDFQFGCSVVLKDVFFLKDFLNDLSEAAQGTVSERAISNVLSVTDYAFTGGSRKPAASFTYGGFCRSDSKIDESDHKILKALSAHPTATHSAVSRLISVPLATTTYRIQRLVDIGIIVGYQSLFQFSSSNFQAFRVLINSNAASKLFREKLRSLCSAHPQVYFLVELIGSWDFEIGILTKNSTEALHFSLMLQEKLGGELGATRILTDSRLLKLAPYPFEFHKPTQPDASQRVERLRRPVFA